MDPYRSGRGLAVAIVILVALQMVLGVLDTALCATLFSSQEPDHLFMAGTMEISGLSSLLYMATWVVFLVWVYRTTANLPVLGTLNIRFKPAAAVWGLIIPILNIARSYQVMENIWIESQPAVLDERGVPRRRHAPRVTAWYVAMVVGTVLGRFSTTTAMGVGDAVSIAVTGIIDNVAWLVAGALFISLVWGAQKRQDEQWNDLERQRAVPQPNANTLR